MLSDETRIVTIRAAFGLYWLFLISACVLAKKRPAAKVAAYLLLTLGASAALVMVTINGIH